MTSLLGFIMTLAASAADDFTVRGVVVDGHDQPVAEAIVYLFQTENLWKASEPKSGRTNAKGEFTVKGHSADPGWIVLAYKRGLALDGRIVSSGTHDEGDRSEIRIQLPQTQSVCLRVEESDGRPAAGRQVDPHILSLMQPSGNGSNAARLSAPLPQELVKQLRVTTDDSGKAVLSYLSKQGRLNIRVQASDLGVQSTTVTPSHPQQTMRLRPTGRVEGRVLADEAAAVRKVKVFFYAAPTATDGAAPDSEVESRHVLPTYGLAEAETDDRGCFVVPALAAGKASASAEGTDRSHWTWDGLEIAEIAAGKTSKLEIPLEKGFRVVGRVVDVETGDPVPGALLGAGHSSFGTGIHGGYSCFISIREAQNAQVHLYRLPPPWLMPVEQFQSITVPASGGEYQVPDFRVRAARPIIGFVSDEEGRPVADARILARFTKREEHLATAGQDPSIQSDDKGRFRLQQIAPNTEVELMARTDDRATRKAVTAISGQDAEVRLTVERSAVVHLEGRVVDAAGQPIPDATVAIHDSRSPSSGLLCDKADGQADDPAIRTNQAGVFRTPFKVLRSNTHSLQVSAVGMLPKRVSHKPADEENSVSRLEDITLSPIPSAAGVVVDPAGKPISGVTVSSAGFARPQAIGATTKVRDRTDKEGRFQIAGLHPNARFVFAEREGFRMTGCALGESTTALRIVMTPVGLPSPAPPLKFLKRSPEEKGRLLKRLIEPLFQKLVGDRSSRGIAEAAKRLAPYEPEIVMEQWDHLGDAGRVDVLLAMAEVDEAFEVASAIDDTYGKTFTLVQVATIADAVQRRKILAEALVSARAVAAPAQRVVTLAAIAERLYDMGDKKLAQAIVREGQPTAAQLATTEWNGFARGYFAEVVALFDPATAFQLVKELKDPSARNRHYGNIAHELAELNPAEAERFHGQLKEDNSATHNCVPVCYRMARADLPRARRIADAPLPAHHEATRPHTYGVMAMALAEEDPETARSLLRTAFDQIGRGDPNDVYQERRFAVGFILLRFAAMIDRESSNECFWKALSLHPGPATEDWSSTSSAHMASESVSKLVILLSLYDRFPELQRRLMEPVRHRLEQTSQSPAAYRQDATLTALALTDPDKTIAWHRASLEPRSWKPIAEALGNDGEKLGQVISETVFSRWTIDQEDF